MAMASKPWADASLTRSLMRPRPSSRLNSECKCRWTKSFGAMGTQGWYRPRSPGGAGRGGRGRARDWGRVGPGGRGTGGGWGRAGAGRGRGARGLGRGRWGGAGAPRRFVPPGRPNDRRDPGAGLTRSPEAPKTGLRRASFADRPTQATDRAPTRPRGAPRSGRPAGKRRLASCMGQTGPTRKGQPGPGDGMDGAPRNAGQVAAKSVESSSGACPAATADATSEHAMRT